MSIRGSASPKNKFQAYTLTDPNSPRIQQEIYLVKSL